jgi:hypothetical protein
MAALRDITEKINEFDRIYNDWLRRDVLAACNAQIKAASDKVTEFNDWCKTSGEELKPEKVELDRTYAELKALEKEITDGERRLFAKPNPTDAAAVEQYKKKVVEFNSLTAKQRTLSSDYLPRQEVFNQRVKDQNREMDRRERDIAAVKLEAQAAERTWDRYQFWLRERGAERLHRELGRTYAALHEMLPRADENSGMVNAFIVKIRDFRTELFEHAREQEQKRDHGFLIVEAGVSSVDVARKETCYLVVDSACTALTLSPAMVAVLGLSDRLGEEVEIKLAGNQTARGREIILPGVVVQGKEAREIRGIQLEESHPGVDGSLGLSFLDRFEWKITGSPQQLLLRRKDEPDRYDVFISFNFEDEWFARVLYDALTVMNYRAFLSEIELRRHGDANFVRAIGDAIQGSRHMVVVGSSAKNMNSNWVRYELDTFFTLKMSGKKTGVLIPVLCEEMSPEQLEPPLNSHQAIKIKDPDFRGKLRDYLPRG